MVYRNPPQMVKDCQEWIKRFMVHHSLSVSDMQSQTGIADTHIAAVICGDVEPTFVFMERFLETYGVHPLLAVYARSCEDPTPEVAELMDKVAELLQKKAFSKIEVNTQPALSKTGKTKKRPRATA